MPDSSLEQFGKEITNHDWKEVLETENIDEKVENFHKIL